MPKIIPDRDDTFETNSLNAPLMGLLMEYIYSEGVFDPAKRVPILVLRSGEDTYTTSANTGPVTVEGLSFIDGIIRQFNSQSRSFNLRQYGRDSPRRPCQGLEPPAGSRHGHK